MAHSGTPSNWQTADVALRATWGDALSNHALERLAGPVVFQRGATYATGGAVQQLQGAVQDDALHADAVVAGTQDYCAALDLDPGSAVQGDCDGPHAQDGYFCQHQGAQAWSVRSLLGDKAIAANPQAAKKVAAAARRCRRQPARDVAAARKKDQQALEPALPPRRCQGDWLLQLAKRLPRAQYPQAATLLLRVFDTVMPQANAPYARELELVRAIVHRQPPEQARAWVAGLQATYKTQRHFIKGLPHV